MGAAGREIEPVTATYHTVVTGWQDALSQYSDERILDLGCGGNSAVQSYAGTDNEIVQLDVNRPDLDTLQDQYTEPVNIVQGDGRTLPFTDDTFDVTWLGCVIAVGAGSSPLRFAHTDVPRILTKGGDLHVASSFSSNCFNTEDALHHVRMEPYADAFDAVELAGNVLSFTGFHGDDAMPTLAYTGDVTDDQLDALLTDADTVLDNVPGGYRAPIDTQGYWSARRHVEEHMSDYLSDPEPYTTGPAHVDVLKHEDTLHVYADVPLTDRIAGYTRDHHTFTAELALPDAATYLLEHDLDEA